MSNFAQWLKSPERKALDWVTESEILLNNGLIPCGGCESYKYNQGTFIQLCPFRPDFASPCGRIRKPGTQNLRTGRKPKNEGQDHQQSAAGSGNTEAFDPEEGGPGCLTDARLLQLSF